MKVEKLFSPFSFVRKKGALNVYDQNITDVVTRPEQSGPSTVFVCCRTPLGDGHDRAVEAYARGCRCFVASRGLGLPEDAAVYLTEEPLAHLGELAARCFGYPARSLTVLGVTGTHGKTSVVDATAVLLSGAGRRVVTLTTDGTTLDGVSTPLDLAPDAADIQRLLRRARRKRCEVAVLELSAYMVAHHAEKSIPFAAILCTGLAPRGREAGSFRDLAAYEGAWAKLLDAGAPLCFLPTGLALPDRGGRAVTFGDQGTVGVENAHFEVRDGLLGTALVLTHEGQQAEAFYPNASCGAAQNVAAATALALATGVSLEQIAALLPKAASVGRLEHICTHNGARIFRDSAFEATDLVAALGALRPLTSGHLIVVLGSVGERARARRAPLGLAATAHADLVYFTADDPGSEPVSAIVEDMVAGVTDKRRYLTIPSRRAAIEHAVQALRPGDTLLVLGKPRDNTQRISGAREAFSDQDIIISIARRA